MAALKNCCCCCEVKTGVVIIAILGWIFTLIKIFGLVSILDEYHRATAPVSLLENMINYGSNDQYSYYKTNQLFPEVDTYVNRFMGFQIGYAVLSLIVCILLVVGVAKKNRFYLLPWMIISFMEYLLFSIAVIIVFGILIGFTHDTYIAGLPIFFFVLFSLISAFCWYLWVVVQSYFVQLKEESITGHLLIPTYEN